VKWLIYKNTIPNASAVLFQRDAYLSGRVSSGAHAHLR